MKFEPVKYKQYDKDPVGCFEAHMTADGWAETKYVNNASPILFSSEVSEFFRLVDSFFKECPDWQKLQKFTKKYGTEVRTDFGSIQAVNFHGDHLNYTMRIDGTTVAIEPYRKGRNA